MLFPGNVIDEDDEMLVFLDRYMRAYGYTPVAPKGHREQVTADFTLEECFRLQSLVYRMAGAVREEVGADVPLYVRERSGERGRPLARRAAAAGVPYEDQQGVWAGWDGGVLRIPGQEMSRLAGLIGRRS